MQYDAEFRANRTLGNVTYDVVGIVIADDGTRTETVLETGLYTAREAELLVGEYLGDIAAQAERAVGWDPNP